MNLFIYFIQNILHVFPFLMTTGGCAFMAAIKVDSYLN